MKLNEEIKAKSRTIGKLKAEITELTIYSKGYEKGIKEIRKELLVLRFVNKTKTSLLRKYADKLEGAHKYIDVADLRPQLKQYMQSDFSKVSHFLGENMYLKNQLKSLADQTALLNTTGLCDFFIQKLEAHDLEKSSQANKQTDQMKKTRLKITSLTNTLELHKNNRSHIPGVIHGLFEDYFRNNDKEKSIDRALNEAKRSRPTNKARDVFLTAEKDNEFEFEKFFIRDFNIEFYSGLDEEQRRELLQRIMSNKRLMFDFREFLLRKLDPINASYRDTVRNRGREKSSREYTGSREDLDVTTFVKRKDRTTSSSRIELERATDSITSKSINIRTNQKQPQPRVQRLDSSSIVMGTMHPKLAVTDITFQGPRRGSREKDSGVHPNLHADVLIKRKMLRYIVRHTGSGYLGANLT